jgi:hypothetical protein
MPARDKEPTVIGHNEETFEYFTKLAKYKKRQMEIQDQLIRERNINVNDLQALHKAILDSEQQARQEFGL